MNYTMKNKSTPNWKWSIYLLFSAEDVLQLFEKVMNHLSDKKFKTELVSAIISLNAALKFFGEQIEASNKDRIDKFQVN